MIEKNKIYRPINRLLIANRGEVSERIIRTARKSGITTIGICTDLEPETAADESAFLEGLTLQETFLNIPAIIRLAKEFRADAIHPGYGFLSESAKFASEVEKAGIIFIGSSPEHIALMGNKIKAVDLAEKLSIPTIFSVHGSIAEILQQSFSLKFPLLIKAAFGGGGKAMLLVRDKASLESQLHQATREAANYFGDATVFVEQYISQARHVEVQVLGDKYGKLVHLFERECSIQRRYQKIIEEAPAPNLDAKIRERLINDAIKLCENIAYYGAGTVEFLVDPSGQHYFLEMNTRLQVEHPVTEMLTGIDIVEQQILISSGLPLSIEQDEIKSRGHAIECRIYAEKAHDDFRPSPGCLYAVNWPSSELVRTDTWFYDEVEIHPTFDPMLAKLIAHGDSREQALLKMRQALESVRLSGIYTNIDYLIALISDKNFRAAKLSTLFCKEFIYAVPELPSQAELAIAAQLCLTKPVETQSSVLSLWYSIEFRTALQQISFSIDADEYIVEWEKLLQADAREIRLNDGKPSLVTQIEIEKEKITFIHEGKRTSFFYKKTANGCFLIEKRPYHFMIRPSWKLPDKPQHNISHPVSNNNNCIYLKAPIPGRLAEVKVISGQKILKGDVLVVLEAMKMENHLQAEYEGIVKRVNFHAGQQVKANEVILELDIDR